MVCIGKTYAACISCSIDIYIEASPIWIGKPQLHNNMKVREIRESSWFMAGGQKRTRVKAQPIGCRQWYCTSFRIILIL